MFAFAVADAVARPCASRPNELLLASLAALIRCAACSAELPTLAYSAITTEPSAVIRTAACRSPAIFKPPRTEVGHPQGLTS